MSAKIIQLRPQGRSQRADTPHEIFQCSFVKRVPVEGKKRAKQWSFWHVEPSGDYSTDYRRGEYMAFEFMEAHGKRRCFGTFGVNVFKDMAKADQEAHHGLICGFWNTLMRFSQGAWTKDNMARALEIAEDGWTRDAHLMAVLRKRDATQQSGPTKGQ